MNANEYFSSIRLSYFVFNCGGTIMGEKVYPFSLNQYLVKEGNDELVVALDQSTSQTGIAVFNLTKKKMIIVADLKNIYHIDKKAYTDILLHFLSDLVERTNVKFLVLEKSIPGVNNRTNNMLIKLRRDIERWCDRFVYVRYAGLGEVFPNVWRSYFLRSKEYKGRKGARETVKLCCAEEVVKRFPEVLPYISYCGSSLDGIEAIGILQGWLEMSFTPDGRICINSSMITGKETRHDFYQYVLPAKSMQEAVKKCVDKFDKAEVIERGNLVDTKYVYNLNLSDYDNARIATTNVETPLILEIPYSRRYIAYSWRCGKFNEATEKFYLTCMRKNRLKKVNKSLSPSQIALIVTSSNRSESADDFWEVFKK